MSTPIVIGKIFDDPDIKFEASYHYVGDGDVPVVVDDLPMEDTHLLTMVDIRLLHAMEFLSEHKNID